MTKEPPCPECGRLYIAHGTPVYEAIERILDEYSAWIARPSDEVTKAVAFAATVAAHRIVDETARTAEVRGADGRDDHRDDGVARDCRVHLVQPRHAAGRHAAAGEGAVDKYRGVPPYAETRHYVRKILALVGAMSHPFDAKVTAPSPSLPLMRVAGLPVTLRR